MTVRQKSVKNYIFRKEEMDRRPCVEETVEYERKYSF